MIVRDRNGERRRKVAIQRWHIRGTTSARMHACTHQQNTIAKLNNLEIGRASGARARMKIRIQVEIFYKHKCNKSMV